MDNQTIALVFMICSYVLYVGTVAIKFGVQPSISDSFYCWKGDWKYLFTAFIWVFGGSAILYGWYGGESWITIICGMFMCLIGAMPHLTSKEVQRFHMIGAYGCILGSQVLIAFDYKMYWVNLVCIVLSVIFAIRKKNKIWNIENVVIPAIILVLILEKFN